MRQTSSPGRRPPQTGRSLRHLALAVFAVAVVALLPHASRGTPETGTIAGGNRAWTPMSPVKVAFTTVSSGQTAKAKLLAFNDFHGNIDPPAGSDGLVNGRSVGSVG